MEYTVYLGEGSSEVEGVFIRGSFKNPNPTVECRNEVIDDCAGVDVVREKVGAIDNGPVTHRLDASELASHNDAVMELDTAEDRPV